MGTTRLDMSRTYLKPAVLILATFLLSGPVSALDGNTTGRLLPVGDQAQALHAGYVLPKEKLVGTVIGARERKTFFGTGDTLYIRFVRNLDVHAGEWVTAYRMSSPVFHPITTAYMGRLVTILGIIEVSAEPINRVAEARVIHGLDALAPGDPVMLYTMPAGAPDQRSSEAVTGTVVEFKQQGMLTAQGEIVYIDLGAQDGVSVGDRMKVIRAGSRESLKTFLPDYALAELKVLSVQERTATTKVVKSLNTLQRGDLVTRLPFSQTASQTASPGEERVEDVVGIPSKTDQDAPASQEPASQVAARGTLKAVYFPYDRWSFSPADLTEATEFLKENPTKKLLIEGYADERGTREYNLILGEKRARAISQYLESHGFANPVTVTSYGKERPVCTEDEESCHSKNRRAQFVFDDN